MSYSYARSAAGYKGERPSPIKKVPGVRNVVWDKEIGRWIQVRATR